MKLFRVLNINNNHRIKSFFIEAVTIPAMLNFEGGMRQNEAFVHLSSLHVTQINGKYRIRNKDKHGV